MTRETPPVSDATTEEGAISGNRWEGETHLGLMVVGCPGDPARIGEVALLPEGRRFILSRGSEVADQLTFGRLRPGLWEAGGPWTLRQMSRRQLSVWADSGSVRVEQLGRGELRVAGQPTLVGRAQVGDLVAVDRHLLLRCVARPSTLPIPKLFPRALIPGYALADVGGFVGESPDAWKLRDAAALAAAQSNPVVVIGEPGYGRRALARLILALRKPDGCVVWDAGAQIEAHALESLFGSLEHAGALAGAARGTLWISHA
ncbi:MAG: hypothetical protein KC492_04260, partial [Myxococcales bacterium]|nr:hypothetical protein [Myxococcales bacterium]